MADRMSRPLSRVRQAPAELLLLFPTLLRCEQEARSPTRARATRLPESAADTRAFAQAHEVSCRSRYRPTRRRATRVGDCPPSRRARWPLRFGLAGDEVPRVWHMRPARQRDELREDPRLLPAALLRPRPIHRARSIHCRTA